MNVIDIAFIIFHKDSDFSSICQQMRALSSICLLPVTPGSRDVEFTLLHSSSSLVLVSSSDLLVAISDTRIYRV